MAPEAQPSTEQQHDEQFWAGFYNPEFDGGDDPDPEKDKGGDDPNKTADPVDLSAYSGDNLEALITKHGVDAEASAAIKEVVGGLVVEATKLSKQVDTLRVSDLNRDAKQSRSERLAEVEAKHPGWEELPNDDKFKAWFEKQPAYVQRVMGTTQDPKEFIEILGQFKAYTADADPDPDNKELTAEEKAAATKKAKEEAAAAKAKEEQEEADAAVRQGAREPQAKNAKERAAPMPSVGADEGFFAGWDAADKEYQKDQ